MASTAAARIGQADGADGIDMTMLEAVVLTACVAVIVGAVGSAAHVVRRSDKGAVDGLRSREFWWRLEDDVEHECDDRNALADTATARVRRLRQERAMALGEASTVLDGVLDTAVRSAERLRRQRKEAKDTARDKALADEKVAIGELLRVTREHFNETRQAIKEARAERSRELDELNEALDALASRELPEDELAELMREARRLVAERDEIQRRRHDAAAAANEASSDVSALETQLAQLSAQIAELEDRDPLSPEELGAEHTALKEQVTAWRRESRAWIDHELRRLDAVADDRRAADRDAAHAEKVAAMAAEDADEAACTQALLDEHDRLMAELKSEFATDGGPGYMDIAADPLDE
mmetsp:Transcript_32433/g.97736  ORF Transcript_32433/g.97736 Transcript_32433/m.97736 type:complete len:355 (-) Transcript_32433:92-1156(-)